MFQAIQSPNDSLKETPSNEKHEYWNMVRRSGSFSPPDTTDVSARRSRGRSGTDAGGFLPNAGSSRYSTSRGQGRPGEVDHPHLSSRRHGPSRILRPETV